MSATTSERTIGGAMTRRGGAVVRAAAAVAVLAVVGCGTDNSSTGSSTDASGPVDPGRSGTKVVQHLPIYNEGAPRPVPAGDYATAAPYGFFPGLKLTIPTGWTVTENDGGELGLHPASQPENALLLWKDMAAVVTNNRGQKVGQVRDDVGRTAKDLIRWLTTTSDFSILAKPAEVTVHSSLTGKQLTLGVSRTANFGWDDCPDNPRCAAIFTDPQHWGSNFYAIGGAEVSRIFIATIRYPEGDHTFFITLDSPTKEALAAFDTEAQPLVQSLQLPEHYTAN